MRASICGPKNEFSKKLHQEKYRIPGESFAEFAKRIANTLADNDNHRRHLEELVRTQAWLPAGRQQLAVGNPSKVTSFNCFVSQKVNDSSEGILDANTNAFLTMRMGGGIGMDFSTIRPMGDEIRSIRSPASGPISFMNIWDATCRAVQSQGLRRGAMMGVLRVDHPDIRKFITCKKTKHFVDLEQVQELMDKDPDISLKQAMMMIEAKGGIEEVGALTSFNVSIGLTDTFMEALLAPMVQDQFFWTKFRGEKRERIHAPTLWDEIMRNTWDYAEPGVLFIDRINYLNNLWYCEDIHATNPCGEIPLPAYGACLLGSMNLTKYLSLTSNGPIFRWSLYRKDLAAVVRATDNIIDRSLYPLPEQEKESKDKRRMGIGVTGLANVIEILGHKYASDGYIEKQSQILQVHRDTAYRTSIELAKEKGAFPLFDEEKFMQGRFIRTLPDDIQEGIQKHGIRNGHLLSIAPTGTISLCADNVSSGIEPPFLLEYERDVQLEEGMKTVKVRDWAWEYHGHDCLTADEISAGDHVRVLCAAQKYIDSSISKTCNVGDSVTYEEFKKIYIDAYRGGAKGCTTYRAAGKRRGVLRSIEGDEASACTIDPETGTRTCE